MNEIIYSSTQKIPWDTQSAFKINTYYTQKEEFMVFSYLKAYVHNGDLILCSYCFNRYPKENKDLQLSLNLNPLKSDDFLHIEYGIDGINNIKMVYDEKEEILKDTITHSSYKDDDEQGYYWAFEICIKEDLIKKYFSTFLKEKSIISLNLHQIYANSDDFSCLLDTKENTLSAKRKYQKQLVILNY